MIRTRCSSLDALVPPLRVLAGVGERGEPGGFRDCANRLDAPRASELESDALASRQRLDDARALGVDARVLDGGFDKWKEEGRPVEIGAPKTYPATIFRAAPRAGLFVDKDLVRARIGDPSTVIVNALGPQFHRGLEPSRYGRPGRVPGSVNVPAAALTNTDKTLTSLADAEAKFVAAGVTRDKQVIRYCGGGISATIDLLLLTQLGYDRLALYDASMGEWARDPALPIETD